MICSHALMKRSLDLIRDLMFALEAADGAELLKVPTLAAYSRHQVDHHFRLLMEAGLATAGYISTDGRCWVAVRLTWSGHDYLDTIRDGRIWKQTKSAMHKVGSWSLDTMSAVARSMIVARLEALGIEIGIR
jgi:hypothetical protein